MAIPDFSTKTIDTLARRARYQCSNPDCGAYTSGPNSDPEKATVIGEAAHIFGAKPDAKRYSPAMSDHARAEITNGIWLCRNCHGQIDRDSVRYSAEILFRWRLEHEERVLREIGTRGAQIAYEVENAKFAFLKGYSPLIRRIVIDKPDGWEWRLAAELLRDLNKSEFKRLRNLQRGHYYRPGSHVARDDFLTWLRNRVQIMSNLAQPLVGLLDRLTESFGPPGEPGDAEEIHEVCGLIHGALKVLVDHEEEMLFALLPDECEELRSIILHAMRGNAEKLEEIPDKLDEAIEMLSSVGAQKTDGERKTITHTIVFNVPEDFERRYDEALSRYIDSL